FQAEDGIRDRNVTGVQTCALPISSAKNEFLAKGFAEASLREICKNAGVTTGALYKRFSGKEALFEALISPTLQAVETLVSQTERSEERRVGKEWRAGGWA